MQCFNNLLVLGGPHLGGKMIEKTHQFAQIQITAELSKPMAFLISLVTDANITIILLLTVETSMMLILTRQLCAVPAVVVAHHKQMTRKPELSSYGARHPTQVLAWQLSSLPAGSCFMSHTHLHLQLAPPQLSPIVEWIAEGLRLRPSDRNNS